MEHKYECQVVVISVHSDFSKREVIPLCAEAACLTCSLCFICKGGWVWIDKGFPGLVEI